MTYEIEDLDLKNNSEEEQLRTRLIFEDLKLKAQNGVSLTEHEKDFFCEVVLFIFSMVFYFEKSICIKYYSTAILLIPNR